MPRHAPGEIPEYIVQRKEKQRLQVLEEAHERARKALVPDGFRLVPDTERALAEKATREMWQEAMSRFVRMPPHDGVLMLLSRGLPSAAAQAGAAQPAVALTSVLPPA